MAEQKYDLIPQMSFKKMGCDPKEAVRQEANVYLVRVYGEATAIKTKEAKNGDTYSYIIGTFRAVTANNKRFESEKLFLPGTLMETIEAQLATGGGESVTFAWDIFAAPDDNTLGYRYAAKTLMKPEVTERLSALSKEIESKPAPEQEKKKKSEK